jgi:hypothetical protein
MGYRVKRRAGTTPPDELLTFDPEGWAPPGTVGDPWRETKAHAAWCAARASWSSTTPWPNGEGQRQIEEAIVTPDEAFEVG